METNLERLQKSFEIVASGFAVAVPVAMAVIVVMVVVAVVCLSGLCSRGGCTREQSESKLESDV
jgi:TRAP-type uncharacterized transport system fused permease subunit